MKLGNQPVSLPGTILWKCRSSREHSGLVHEAANCAFVSQGNQRREKDVVGEEAAAVGRRDTTEELKMLKD